MRQIKLASNDNDITAKLKMTINSKIHQLHVLLSKNIELGNLLELKDEASDNDYIEFGDIMLRQRLLLAEIDSLMISLKQMIMMISKNKRVQIEWDEISEEDLKAVRDSYFHKIME